MLRTQVKKQGSSYVCASCRRQHQYDLAQVRPSSRIPSRHLSTTSRPFAPFAPTVSKPPTSLGSQYGAPRSCYGLPSQTTRSHARSNGSWSRFGSPSLPRQSNASWESAPKHTPTPATSSPAPSAWTAPSQLPAATGTSAWGAPNKMTPGAGASAWGGLGSKLNGSGTPAWAGSATSPPNPGTSSAEMRSGRGLPPVQPDKSAGGGIPPRSASVSGGPGQQSDAQQGGKVAGSGAAPGPVPPHGAAFTPPPNRGANSYAPRSASGPLNSAPMPNPPSTTYSRPPTTNAAHPPPPSATGFAGTHGFGNSPRSTREATTSRAPPGGKPNIGGRSGAVAERPAYGGSSSWNPSKPAFGGAQAWTPGKTASGASNIPANDTSTVRGRDSEFSAWKQRGEVSYTGPPRPSQGMPSAQNLRYAGSRASSETQFQSQRRSPDPVMDASFIKPPIRKPPPGAEFPQLPRRSPKKDMFESMSPFKLPSKQGLRDSTIPPPGSPQNAMTPGPPDSSSDQPLGRNDQWSRMDRRPVQAANSTPLSSDAFGTAFRSQAEGPSSEFRALSKHRTETRDTRNRDSSAQAVPSDESGEAPARGDARYYTPPTTDQYAPPPENRRRGRDFDRGRDLDTRNRERDYRERERDRDHRGRGRDFVQSEDVYAARDKANRRKKFGGIRKQHVEDDEGPDEFDYEDTRVRRQQRRKNAQERAAEEAAEAAAAHKTIRLPEYITVYDLAGALRIKPAAFLRDLELLGFENTLQDSVMTGETAALVAAEYGFEPTVESGDNVDLRPRPPPEDPTSLPPRPPIVTIMGHVDHGKTTILDTLRKSSIVAQEFGGITQHIGAFSVKMSKGKTITFLDTPGHAAFLSMRQRGAIVTDIVVLVVAVDDSVKPQTIEAIKHAQNAKVPMIVAINKIDVDDTPKRIDIVKQDLADHDVDIEDYGGDVQAVPISGKTGRGMRDLEDAILTLSEVLDMRAETDGMAEGWVLEASIKPDGRAATILVKRGTMRVGDLIVSGAAYTKVRIMRNEAGVDIEEAGPGTPIEVYGSWKGEPMAGDMVLQAPDETKAQAAVGYRQEIAERAIAAAQNAERESQEREKAEREALKKLAEEAEEGEGEDEAEVVEVGQKVVSIIVKGDVMGSVEAVSMAIQEVGNNEVRARILRSSPGQITESDVDHMATAKGAIVNFNSPIPGHILQRADRAGVVILDHNIIYETVQAVKDLLSAQLPPIYTQRVVAEAMVQQIFPINITKRKFKNIAGAKVVNNKITRGGQYRVIRGEEEIHKGKLAALKQEKDDVTEVRNGIECGIMFEHFDEFEEGDRIQLYEDVQQKRYL